MRIDAHQHFWQYNPVQYGWIDESMADIQRDFLPQDLRPLLEQHDMDGCVLVQTEQTEESNTFLLQAAADNSFIKGVVGWVDLSDAAIEEKLTVYREQSIIKGFRHILQGEKDRAFMLQEEFCRGIGALKRFNYTYDILIYPDQLPFTETFLKKFGDQLFVIDHLAKPFIKTGELQQWKEDMEELAKHPNVYCKLSGMVTEANWKNWRKETFLPYMDVVVDAFGTNRLLFGSDWPVCLVAASYNQVLQLVEDYFAAFSTDEKENIFGGNASRFYSLV